jgi:hypothetical protein
MCSREVVRFQWGTNWIFRYYLERNYSLCGLVVRVPGYRSTGPGFDSRRHQIFWEVVGLGTGSTQPPEYNWGAAWKKKVAASVYKPRLRPWGSVPLTTQHLLSTEVDTNFAVKRYFSLTDSGRGVNFFPLELSPSWEADSCTATQERHRSRTKATELII